jgi:uncharacterized protein
VTGSLVYLDSSAIVKLIVPEPESSALFHWLATRPERISSGVARVEVIRALRRSGLFRISRRRAIAVLERIALLPIDLPILETAAELEPSDLRSLDAIHLATAMSLGADLAGVVTYDERLAGAARAGRIEVWAPA